MERSELGPTGPWTADGSPSPVALCATLEPGHFFRQKRRRSADCQVRSGRNWPRVVEAARRVSNANRCGLQVGAPGEKCPNVSIALCGTETAPPEGRFMGRRDLSFDTSIGAMNLRLLHLTRFRSRNAGSKPALSPAGRRRGFTRWTARGMGYRSPRREPPGRSSGSWGDGIQPRTGYGAVPLRRNEARPSAFPGSSARVLTGAPIGEERRGRAFCFSAVSGESSAVIPSKLLLQDQSRQACPAVPKQPSPGWGLIKRKNIWRSPDLTITQRWPFSTLP